MGIEKDGVESGFSGENYGNSLKTAFIGTLTGFSATVITVYCAVTSNSLAVVADMFATIFEFLAIALSYVTLLKMKKKGREIYNYGYGKLEVATGMAVAGFMMLSLIIIAFNAVNRFAAPTPISGGSLWIIMIAHFIFLMINGVLFYRSLRVSKSETSSLVDSQVRLFGSKLFANFCMAVTLIAGLFFSHYRFVLYMDPVTSLLIALIMFSGTYHIVRKGIDDLLDKTLEEDLQFKILRELTANFEDYTAFYGIRSRRSGKRIFIEVFLEFDKAKRHADVQQTMDNIRKALEIRIPGSDVNIVSR